MHVYESTPTAVHVPSFKHCIDWHASVSICLIQLYLYSFAVYLQSTKKNTFAWEIWLGWLNQNLFVNTYIKSHMKEIILVFFRDLKVE